MKADIIEQMACPFGCCSGGGQPKGKTFAKRIEGMNHLDEQSTVKAAGDNKTLESHTLSEDEMRRMFYTTFHGKTRK